MEAFHLPVRLGPVGADQFVSSADLGEGIGEDLAVAVGHGVVGHYPVDAIPPGGEPVGGAEHEPGTGLGVLGVEDF